jgi:hypothetical protein
MLARINLVRRRTSTIFALLWFCSSLFPLTIAAADSSAPQQIQLAQAASAPAAPSSAKAPAPVPITDADIKHVFGPSKDQLAKGDPGGVLTIHALITV